MQTRHRERRELKRRDRRDRRERRELKMGRHGRVRASARPDPSDLRTNCHRHHDARERRSGNARGSGRAEARTLPAIDPFNTVRVTIYHDFPRSCRPQIDANSTKRRPLVLGDPGDLGVSIPSVTCFLFNIRLQAAHALTPERPVILQPVVYRL